MFYIVPADVKALYPSWYRDTVTLENALERHSFFNTIRPAKALLK